MKASRIPLAVLLVISGIAVAGDGDAPKEASAKFKITTRRKDDSVEVRAVKGKAVFVVKSPSGISQAVIERQEDTWPRAKSSQFAWNVLSISSRTASSSMACSCLLRMLP